MDRFSTISRISNILESDEQLSVKLRRISSVIKNYLQASFVVCIPRTQDILLEGFTIPREFEAGKNTIRNLEKRIEKNRPISFERISSESSFYSIWLGKEQRKYASLHFGINGTFARKEREIEDLLMVARTLLLKEIEEARLTGNLKLTEGAIDAALKSNPQLLTEMSLRKVLKSLLVTAINLIPVDLAHIFLYDGNVITFGAAMGPDGLWDKPFSEPRKNGITYTVAKTGRAKIISDIQKSRFFSDAPPDWEGSIVSLPLKIGRRVVGVMNISSFKPGPFPKEAIRIWKLFSNQAAVAIENARLAEEERKHIEQLKALRSSIATINSSLELKEVFNTILDEIRKVIHYDSASVMLLHGKYVQVLAGKNLPMKENAIGKRYKVTELEEMLARKKEPVILDDASTSHYFKKWGNTDYVRGWMGVPMISQDGVIGYITLDSRKQGFFTESDAQLALSFAHHAAIAVKNAMLHTSLKNKMNALKEFQAKLVMNEKLASIGKLVAGIAHELNNPLAAVMGIAQLLKMEELNEDQLKLVDTLIEETKRSASIVKNLLSFAKQQKAQKTRLNLGDIIEKVLSQYREKEDTENINMVLSKRGNDFFIAGDRYKIEQVFFNIIDNAVQAIEDTCRDGLVTVIMEKGKPRYPLATLTEGEEEKRIIRVVIEDNGPGIPKEALPHIFDPFYTTKPTGKGTGLGLSVTHGIISEHGGNIWAENAENGGARFFIELPESGMPEESQGKDGEEGEGVLRGEGYDYDEGISSREKPRIILIEDEESLGKILDRFLKRKGYETASFQNGKRALEFIEHSETASIALIICDIRMPGISGIDIYRELSEKHPELATRFLVITGDTASKESKEFLETFELPYLVKPFDMTTFIDTVESIIKRLYLF